FAPSYVPNPLPENRNRRTIYAHKTRGQRDPFLEVFNQPTPDLSCEMRDASNITPQVFTLFNSEESLDRAIAFADRVLNEREGQTDETAVRRAFMLAYGRQPVTEEISASIQHWKEMTEVQKGISFEPRSYPTEVNRRAADERTGELFSFDEKLRVYERYVHDLQPHEVDARTRGFADLCLVLLNSNEFVYLY
ncbi:MAG: DUF1553 domain-containing protein, partial [Verrucomicrobiota bacterium]